MKVKQWCLNKSSLLILILSLQVGCGGGSDGGSGDQLEGRFVGTAFRESVEIEFNLSQSGTQVTGTVLFDNTTYEYEGSLSGDVLSGSARHRSASDYCKNLVMNQSEVINSNTAISGRIVVRDQNCDGTGLVSGGTGNYAVTKQ